MVRPLFFIKSTAAVAVVASLALSTQGFCGSYHSNVGAIEGGEETILVEKKPSSNKIPYSLIARKVVKRFFDFDTYNVLTYTYSNDTGVARSLSEYISRSDYRLNVKRDEFELKYSLSF